MLVCPDYKFVYIHIHKNAGKAVKHCLRNILKKEKNVRTYVREWQGEEVYNHIGLPSLLERYPDLSDYFSFATVRNPWDRLASAFFWIKSKPEDAPNMNRSHLEWAPNFEFFVHALYESFQENKKKPNNQNMFKKPSVSINPEELAYPAQSVYLFDHERNIEPNALCKQESLFEDLKNIIRTIISPRAAENVKLKVVGPSSKPSYRELYTPEMREMVREIYSEDIARFGYDF